MKNQLQEQQRRVQNAKNEHQKRKKEHEKGMFQSFFRKCHQILFPNYKFLKNSFFGINFEVSNYYEINFETNESPTELCKAHRKK